MGLDALDLLLENLDPLLQLGDRQRPQVLPGNQGQRVLRLAREEVVFIHGGRQR